MPTSRLSVVVPFYFGSVAKSKMGGEERFSVSCIICNIYWMKYTVFVFVKNKIVSDSLLFTVFVQANVELSLLDCTGGEFINTNALSHLKRLLTLIILF